MTDAGQKVAARKVADFWKSKSYEIGQIQPLQVIMIIQDISLVKIYYIPIIKRTFIVNRDFSFCKKLSNQALSAESRRRRGDFAHYSRNIHKEVLTFKYL